MRLKGSSPPLALTLSLSIGNTYPWVRLFFTYELREKSDKSDKIDDRTLGIKELTELVRWINLAGEGTCGSLVR